MPAFRSTSNLSRRTALHFGAGGLAVALSHTRRTPASARTPSTTDANKALVHRLFEDGINGGDVKIFPALYAPAVLANASDPEDVVGLVGLPLPLNEFSLRFPSALVFIDKVVAEQDIVAVFATWRGTHPPAGTHIVGHTQHWFQIADGRIVEQWSAGWDWLG
jgi:predicted SnoaL-like aldol condensation-catalyzing enzyme